MSEPLVLGFETSCDETGIGLVRGHTLLADALATSMDEHERFGGVVPEIASRAHLEAMVPTVHRALAEAGVRASDVDAVAVTAGPGLTGALLAEADRRSPVVLLEVRADNEVAQGLYRRRGFTEIGRRRGYYQPSGDDAVVMKRELLGERTGP